MANVLDNNCIKCKKKVGFSCKDESGLCSNCRRERARGIIEGGGLSEIC